MTEFYKEKINDPRLTPDLQLTRNGKKQEFRKKGQSWHDEPIVALENERPELYAMLTDGEWYWVNGCAYCEDAHPSQKGQSYSYVKCDTHNTCGGCGKHRSEFKEPVWGRSNVAFVCQSCHEIECAADKLEGLSKGAEYDIDEDYHHSYEDKIICPYCLNSFEDEEYSHTNDDGENHQCSNCGEVFTITANISIDYTTAPVRPKEEVYREAGVLDSEEEREDDESDDEESPTAYSASESVLKHLPSRDEMSDVINDALKGQDDD